MQSSLLNQLHLQIFWSFKLVNKLYQTRSLKIDTIVGKRSVILSYDF